MANTYDTSNEPLGSTAVKVLYNNASNLDEAANAQVRTWVDRPPFNRTRKTLYGLEQDFNDFLTGTAFENPPLLYVDGTPLQVDRPTQLVERDGILYGVKLPAAFPVTLTGTWATDEDLLVVRGDESLRQQLASNSGATLVGTSRGNTVELELSDLADSITEIEAQLPTLGKDLARAGLPDFFAQGQACDVMLLGDSNAAGAGSSGGYPTGLLGRFARSFMNVFDKYPGSDRGYMYFTWMNAYQQLLNEPGWSQSGGSPVSGGPAGNAWRMPAGSWVEKTGVEVTQGKVFFAPSTDGSVMTVTVNGVTSTSFPVNANGLSANFNLIAGGAYIKPTDVVRFTCTSGSIDVYGFRLLRAGGSRGPIMYCSPEGSQSFSDYSGSRADLLGRYLNADQPTAAAWVVALFGTNNMITTAGKQKSPAAMVADMQAFVTKWRTIRPGCVITFWTPPRPRADVSLPLGTYEEYVQAIIEFVATQTRVTLFRGDLSGIEGDQFYADPDPVPGVHLNDYGHAAYAKYLCTYVGLSVDTGQPQFSPGRVALTAGSNWTANATSQVITPGSVAITGVMTKGAGGTTAIGQVSTQHTPLENMVFSVPDQAGVPRAVLLTASTRSLSVVNSGELASITNLYFSGQSYRV